MAPQESSGQGGTGLAAHGRRGAGTEGQDGPPTLSVDDKRASDSQNHWSTSLVHRGPARLRTSFLWTLNRRMHTCKCKKGDFCKNKSTTKVRKNAKISTTALELLIKRLVDISNAFGQMDFDISWVTNLFVYSVNLSGKLKPTPYQNKLDNLYGFHSCGIRFAKSWASHCVKTALGVLCGSPPPAAPAPFISPCWIRFWPWDYITDSLFQYETTGAVNGAHSWQTQTPFSPTTAHMYHFFIWGEPQAASAKVSRSDCASWQSPSSFT